MIVVVQAAEGVVLMPLSQFKTMLVQAGVKVMVGSHFMPHMQLQGV